MRLIFYLVLLFFVPFVALAQSKVPNVLLPSPETQALVYIPKYNLGTANGLVDISIPIYTVKSGSLSLPISISYNARGRKVHDLTGPVGMGWSINCGGVISRTVMGKPDENGLLDSVPQSYTLSNNADWEFLSSVYNSYYYPDAQHDIYSYITGGKSGKFIGIGSSGQFKLIPNNPIKINASSNFPTSITDENGDLYQYGAFETCNLSIDNTTYYQNVITAAYLTNMRSPNGDTINISYDEYNYTLYDIGQSRTVYDNQVPESSDQNNNLPQPRINTDQSSQTIYNKKVSQVTFNEGKLIFEYTANNEQIHLIKLFNNSNELLKTFEFIYSVLDATNYVYNSGTGNSQFYKLDEYRVKNKTDVVIEKYQFEYNPSETFRSESRDYWGFRNGTDQTALLENYVIQNISSIGNTYNYNVGNAADRSVNSNFAMHGVLKKVIYPTGGSSEFTYEPNLISYRNNVIEEGPGIRISQIKTINSDGNVSYKTYKYPTGTISIIPQSNYQYRSYERRIFPNYRPADSWQVPSENAYSYRQRVYSSDISPDLQTYFNQPVFYSYVEEFDGTLISNDGKTRYSYEKPTSGGSFSSMSHPTFSSNTYPGSSFYANVNQDYYATDNYIYSLNIDNTPRLTSVFSFKNVGGDDYQSVSNTTYNYTLSSNDVLRDLKIVRYIEFGNSSLNERAAAQYDNFPIYEYANYEVPTGYYELTSEIDNSDGVQQVKTYNYNSHHLYDKVITSKSTGETNVSRLTYPFDYPSDPVLVELDKQNRLYVIENELFKTDFNNPLFATKTTYKNWGNGIFAPEYVKEKSRQNSYENKVSFQGYDNYGNITGVSKTYGPNTSYQWGYNHQYPIAEVKNTASNEFYSENFEEGGTLIAGHTGDHLNLGVYTVNWVRPNNREYILSYWYRLNGSWKYSGDLAYTGSSYTLIGGDAYDDIRICPKDAQMTTYTYEPLVGMTSQTDPSGRTTYYDYDSFQRLEGIKDQDGNILKAFCYNYAGQQTSCFTSSGGIPPPTSLASIEYSCTSIFNVTLHNESSGQNLYYSISDSGTLTGIPGGIYTVSINEQNYSGTHDFILANQTQTGVYVQFPNLTVSGTLSLYIYSH